MKQYLKPLLIFTLCRKLNVILDSYANNSYCIGFHGCLLELCDRVIQ